MISSPKNRNGSQPEQAAKVPGLHYYYPLATPGEPRNVRCDIVVYGGTPAGIAAAIQASRMGKRVVLLVFNSHLGGMTTAGLGATDVGHELAIGGISREFYKRIGRHYNKPLSWRFEPHVAQAIFKSMLDDADIEVHYEKRLADVATEDNRIKSITMECGSTYAASMFIDATYEGDLMAKAGVTYTVGREANRQYHETLNGIHFGHPGHNFKAWVDPYVVPGDPSSGLLPGVQDLPLGHNGQADTSIQAYNFRLCLTNVDNNKLPFPKPNNYDPQRYELLLRYINAGIWDALFLTLPIPNQKTDTNNFGGFSSDHIGANYDWPEGDYHTRERIFQDHVTYNQGMYYFLVNDERVPAEIREEVAKWGLPKDEFMDTGGWPNQLYIREARRMVGDIVMTEHHCRHQQVVEDPIGLAAYTMDSHNCRRLVVDGRLVNEGNVEVEPNAPYRVSYRAIVPRKGECENLLVPWCVSASHIAFGSIRMEPVGMILGQSAATAASLSIDQNLAVQDLPYENLKQQLLTDHQILTWSDGPITTGISQWVEKKSHKQGVSAALVGK